MTVQPSLPIEAETAAYLAAFAAMQASQDAMATLDFYRVIPEWITGMAAAQAGLPTRAA